MFKKTTGYSGVTISGGEPFTFRNIDNLLKVLFEEGAKITVVTNGALLDRHFEALKYVNEAIKINPQDERLKKNKILIEEKNNETL